MKVQLVYACTHCGEMVYEKITEAEKNDGDLRLIGEPVQKIWHECFGKSFNRPKNPYYGICKLVGVATVPDSEAEATNG